MNLRRMSCSSFLFMLVAVSVAVGSDDAAAVAGLRVFPVEGQAMHVVSNGGGGAAGAVEKLIYDNPLGNLVVELPSGFLVSDDIKVAVEDGCELRRYRFQIIGKAHDRACGPVGTPCAPLTVNFRLYEECPLAGGNAILGTEGCASSDPARTDCIEIDSEALTEINVVIPPESPVALPSSVWLGISMSRSGAGVVVGAPAQLGFSDDVLDTLDYPCNSSFGGFPQSAQASFNASVYGDSACAETCMAYQNVRAGADGVNDGVDICLADDLTLNRVCDMVEMEIGVRNRGLYDVELRQSFDSQPIGPCDDGRDSFGQGFEIPGSHKRFLVTRDGMTVRRFVFDTPIRIPSVSLFAVVNMNSPNAQWIMTRRDAAIGSTTASYLVRQDGAWDQRLPADNSHGAMHFAITCADACPIGACCDQYVRDENDEAVCRDLPEINCPFPPKGSELKPAWAEGVACHVCEGGERDGLGCQADADCAGGVCVDNDPFRLPCGVAACCQSDGQCDNLTKNECASVPPHYEPRRWDLGQYCFEDGHRCIATDCFGGTGSCFEADAPASLCVGGPDHRQPCARDADCRGFDDGVCEDIALACIGGDHHGEECINDLDCIPGGLCISRICRGGAQEGSRCQDDRDCEESRCETFLRRGCEDPFCCEMVCNYESWGPWGKKPSVPLAYCCEVQWDWYCAEAAIDICGACPHGDVEWLDPPCGVIDARQPSSFFDANQFEGIDWILARGPAGAVPQCWSVSETTGIPGLSPEYPEDIAEIDIIDVYESAPGSYELILNRPITPGAVTFVSYSESNDTARLNGVAFLPGDVNGDGYTGVADVLALLDALNGVFAPPWGEYSTDIDHSGVTNMADVLGLIDLLNGAGSLESWNNTVLPGPPGGCVDLP